MLSADEIVMHAMKGREPDPEKFAHSMAAYMKQTGSFAVQVRDSVFLIEPRPNHGAEVHMFTAEKSHKDAAHDVVLLSAELKDAGYTHWTATTAENAHHKLAPMTGLPYQQKPVKMKNGKRGIEYTVRLSNG